MAGCENNEVCISSIICNELCGDGLNEIFGNCDPDPLCSIPGCVSSLELTDCQLDGEKKEDKNCNNNCGNGNDPFVGLCSNDPDCDVVTFLIPLIILGVLCVLGCVFFCIYQNNKISYKYPQHQKQQEEVLPVAVAIVKN